MCCRRTKVQVRYLISWWVLVMATHGNRHGHYILQVMWLLSSSVFFLFSSPILSGRKLDVYHDVALRILNAGLKCHATRGSLEMQDPKSRQKIPICTPSHNHISLEPRHLSIIGKNRPIKQQYLKMSSRYSELRPTNGWYRLASLGHPSKFQRVSRLAFVTALTSFNEGQPNFARCLAVSWTVTLYIRFGKDIAP